ncbi:hypothetical protein Hanom_Chr12g01138591 [Helianthus anomalus]
MPMVWRVLIVLNHIKALHVPELCIEANFRELAPPTSESERRIQVVCLLPESDRSFSSQLPTSSQYSSSHMSDKGHISLRISSLCSAPIKTTEVFYLDELDSYSGPVQVKKEPSPKAATSSKRIGSTPTAIPKPSSTTKTCASSTRKRKETDSHTTSEIFPYENDGFVEASGFMTSFLNQEVKLKKAEVTITDQGMIATAKSQHYEDKFKAMAQEHQAAMKKAPHEAKANLDTAQTQHEQDMV